MRVNERMKKLLSILLCLCMLVQNAPVMAFAATTDKADFTDEATQISADIADFGFGLSNVALTANGDGNVSFSYKPMYSSNGGTSWGNQVTVRFTIDSTQCLSEFEYSKNASLTSGGETFAYTLVITKPQGHTYGEWAEAVDGGHTRTCNVCGAADEAECGWETEWKSRGDGTHALYCTVTQAHFETVSCSYVAATCTSQQFCEVCGHKTGSLDENNHAGTELRYENITTQEHTEIHVCCGQSKVEAHSFDGFGICADCKYSCEHVYADGVCSGCGRWEYPCICTAACSEQSVNGICTFCSGGEKWRECPAAGAACTTHTTQKVANQATCQRGSICDKCGAVYGGVAPDVHTAFDAATGTCVCGAAIVAQVGDVYYATLEEAVEVGGSIRLLADVTLPDINALWITKDTAFDLNGHSITGVWGVFDIDGCTLTLTGSGTVKSGDPDMDYAIDVYNGVLNFRGGTVEGNLNVYGTATVSGGRVDCLILGDGTATVTGGRVDRINSYGGTLVVKGGIFGFDPTAYLAEGYIATCNDSDSLWTVTCDHVTEQESHKATCTTPALCDNCGEPYGDPIDHSYGADYKCTLCGADCPHESYTGGYCDDCGKAATYTILWSEDWCLTTKTESFTYGKDLRAEVTIPENTHLRINGVYVNDGSSAPVSYTYENGVLTILADDLPAADIWIDNNHYVYVTFNANGGTIKPEEGYPLEGDNGFAENRSYWIQEHYVHNENVGRFAENHILEVRREGWTWTGDWMDAQGNVYDDDPYVDAPLMADVTLYAQWECNHPSDKVEYRDNGSGSHDGYCSQCGDPLGNYAERPHDYDEIPGQCGLCGHLCDHAGSRHTTATWESGETHSFTCTLCGLTVTGAAHDYAYNAATHTCVCGDVEMFTVTVVLNGGVLAEEMKQMLIQYGYTVTDTQVILPAKYGAGCMANFSGVTKTGYELSGFVDHNGKIYELGERFTLTEHMVLTSQWEAKTYTVTWTMNGQQVATTEVKYGEAVEAPTFDLPEGFTFTGWNVPETMPAEDITLDATLAVKTYTVAWVADGETVETETVEHGAAPTKSPDVPEKDGHTGVWDKELSAVTEDITVNAVYTPNTYYINWVVNGEIHHSEAVTYGQTITVPTGEEFEAMLRREGCTFIGWEGYTEGMTMPVDGITFTAKWRIDDFTLAETDAVYNKNPHTPAVTLPGLTEGKDYTVAYENNVGAGTATVTVTGIGKFSGSVTKSFLIAKAPAPAITFPKVLNSITYDQTLAEAKLEFYENGYGTFNWAAPTAYPDGVGQKSYALDFYPADPQNYAWGSTGSSIWVESRNALCAMGTVTVNPAVGSGSVTMEGWTYGQTAKAPVPVSATNGTDGVSFLYKEQGADDSTYIPQVPANAGSYTVKATFAATAYSTEATATADFTIAKAPLTVTAADNAITYGDSPAHNGMAVTGFVGNENLTDLSGEITFACNYEQFGKVGTYAITPGGLTSGNYEITFVPGTLTVSPRAIRIIADAKTMTYGEEEPELTYKAEGLVNNDTLSGALVCAVGEDVGTYAITQGDLTAGDNYTITYTGAELTVNKRTVTITAKDQTVTYGGAISGTEIISVGLVDGHAAAVTLTPSTANVTVSGTITASAAVITADGTDVTANYEISYATGKLLIEPDTAKIDGLTAENVTSANMEDIKAVQAMMDSAEKDGIDGATAEEWAAITGNCEDLIEKIVETAAEIKAVTDAADAYDADSVNSTDRTELDGLAADIEDLLETDNLTDDERTAIETLWEQVADMLATIEETAAASKDATDTIDALDPATVTSDDEEELEQAIKSIDELLAEDHLTEDEREALIDTKKDAEDLLEKIDAVQDAAKTQNTEKVKDVTSGNVQPENKDDLIDAKADLEKALEDNSGNYTEEEKKAIQDEIQRIEDAIETLENAEDVTDTINNLPETVEPDDEETAKKILAVKAGYDALTDREKSLVDDAAKKKLDALVTALTAYDIIKGDGSKWTKGSSDGLSFTANGPFSKFVGIEVDGKAVAEKYYDAKSGSTVITLKQSFLKKLSTGKHTITVVYTDGEASGTFKILAQSSTPATGDDSHIILWTAVLGISALGIAVLLDSLKRRKPTR